MTITATQLATRRMHVGSSDAAAILGFDKHRSAYDVYLSKVAELEQDEDSERAAIGNWLEPKLVEWAASFVGRPFMASPPTIVAPCGILAANLDGIEDIGGEDPTCFVEAKTTGILDGWGEPGTDEVPERVLCQTAIAFACEPSLEVAWVPVLFGNWGLSRRMYRVVRNEALVKGVADTCRDWWETHVVARKPPTGCWPSMDVLKRIRREPDSCVTLDDKEAAAFALFEEANAERLEAEKRSDEMKQAALSLLGEAESARLPDGRLVTYLKTTRKEHVVKASTYRTLRITKGDSK